MLFNDRSKNNSTRHSTRSSRSVQGNIEPLESRTLLSGTFVETEANNTLATADNLGNISANGNCNFSGNIGLPGDAIDYYEFTLEANATITITDTNGSSTFISTLRLENSVGGLIQADSSGTKGLTANLAAGRYFIRLQQNTPTQVIYAFQLNISNIGVDAFEANDTQATAASLGTITPTSLNINSTINAAVGFEADNVDHYRFLIEPGVITNGTVTLSNLNQNLQLEIFGPGGVFIGSANAGNSNEMITLTNIQAGQYIIRVKGQGSTLKSTYTLQTTLTATALPGPDAFEVNNSFATANVLGNVGPGNLIGTRSANVGFLGDTVDHYSFTISANTVASANLTLTNLNQNLQLEIFGPNGLFMASANTGNNDENILINNLTQGQYVIRVKGQSPTARSTYDLNFNITATTIPIPDTFESNDTIATASDLGSVGPATLVTSPAANIGFLGDVIDHYTFTVNAGFLVSGTISLSGLTDDLQLEVFGPNTFVASANPGNGAETVTLTDIEEGQYIIRVKGQVSNTALTTYLLNVNLTATPFVPDTFEANDTIATASVLGSLGDTLPSATTLVQTINANGGFNGDVDHYQFTVDAGFQASGTISLTGMTEDLNLELLGPANLLLKSTNGLAADELLNVLFLDPGQYVIRIVQGTPGAKSDYTLDVNLSTSTLPGVSDTENNDTIATAIDLGTASLTNPSVNAVVLGNVGFQADNADHFKFAIAAGQVGNGNILLSELTDDLTILVFGPGGFFASSATAGNVSESIALTGLAAGTYTIRIIPSLGDPIAQTTYKLNVDVTIGQDQFESNNTVATASVLGTVTTTTGIDTTLTANVGYSGDTMDHYQFTVAAGTFASGSITLGSFLKDTNITIFGPNGFFRSGGNTGTTQELLNLNNLAAGTYTIKVNTLITTDATSYVLGVNLNGTAEPLILANEPNDDFPNATPLGDLTAANPVLRTFLNDTLGFNNNILNFNADTEDNFAFTLDANLGLTGTVSLSGTTLPVIIQLVGTNGFSEVMQVPANGSHTFNVNATAIPVATTFNIRILPVFAVSTVNYNLAVNLTAS